MKEQLNALLASDSFWVFIGAIGIYFTNSIVSRGLVGRLPTTSPTFRALRWAHGLLNKIDPGGNVTPGIALIAALSATVSGCVGTLEESRAKAQLVYVGPVHLTSDGEKLVKANSTARSAKRCESLSDRESFYGGAAKFGLAATGATGIAIWPIESREAEIGLAIGTTVLAAGTAFSEYVAQKSATQYIEEGCAQK